MLAPWAIPAQPGIVIGGMIVRPWSAGQVSSVPAALAIPKFAPPTLSQNSRETPNRPVTTKLGLIVTVSLATALVLRRYSTLGNSGRTWLLLVYRNSLYRAKKPFLAPN